MLLDRLLGSVHRQIDVVRPADGRRIALADIEMNLLLVDLLRCCDSFLRTVRIVVFAQVEARRVVGLVLVVAVGAWGRETLLH